MQDTSTLSRDELDMSRDAREIYDLAVELNTLVATHIAKGRRTGIESRLGDELEPVYEALKILVEARSEEFPWHIR